jgi:hypothetical protein
MLHATVSLKISPEPQKGPFLLGRQGPSQFENPGFTLPIISESPTLVKLSPSRVAGQFEW